MEISITKPFGPSIAKVKIPTELLDKINEYIDQTIIDKKKSENLNFGNKLVGDVTQEFKLEKDFVSKCGWLDFLGKSVHEWLRVELNKKITKFNLIDTWVVRQFKDEYNPIHWHGGHISGAGFLKVPKTFGTHIQNKSENEYAGGTLNLIHGSRQFMSHAKLTIIPEVGDFYFFPNYLMHTVYPFKGTNEERRSISFNGLIDEKIYDVYGN